MMWQTPAGLLLAHVLLFWTLTNYSIEDPDVPWSRLRLIVVARVAAGGLLVWLVAGWSRGWILAVWFVACAVALPLLRRKRFHRYWAELEITSNVIFLLGATRLAERLHLIHHGRIEVATSNAVIVGITMTAAVLIFIVRGGSHIVRGILEKVAVLPTTAEKKTDEQEVRRGRFIGAIERIVLALAVAAGSYEALGFLVGAKGLIRAKEFDDRAFTEYFIIGSLVSVLIAMLGGIAIRYFLGFVPF